MPSERTRLERLEQEHALVEIVDVDVLALDKLLQRRGGIRRDNPGNRFAMHAEYYVGRRELEESLRLRNLALKVLRCVEGPASRQIAWHDRRTPW